MIAGAAEPGAVGGSIEDYERDGGIYELARAVERVGAACEAAGRLGFPFKVTARAENHIRGNPDLADTIARLQAYEGAGAEVLYAPGLRSGDEIRAVCDATSKPLNVLARPDLSMHEIARRWPQDQCRRRADVGRGERDGDRCEGDARRRRLLLARCATSYRGVARQLLALRISPIRFTGAGPGRIRLLCARALQRALARGRPPRSVAGQ